jgi:Tat protein secretion system quality control protein TatD with DNase activity
MFIKSVAIQIAFQLIVGLLFVASNNAQAYSGPLIDGHLHLSYFSDPEVIREKFKNQTVTKAVIFPREFKAGNDIGITEKQARKFAEKNVDIGYVLLGLQLEMLHNVNIPVRFWTNPSGAWLDWLKYAEEELISGRRKWMGELIIRHYDYHGKGFGENDYPIKSKVFESLIELSNRTRRPLIIHAEGEDHVVRDVLDMLARYPAAKIVWAHGCGRSNPQKVYEWLSSHSNLYCDLGNMTDTGRYGSFWPRAGEWTFQFESGGVIKADWLRVIEKFPDRLYIGSDVNEAQGWNKAWETRIKRFRVLLDQVSPSAQEWLAYKTVETLYGW